MISGPRTITLVATTLAAITLAGCSSTQTAHVEAAIEPPVARVIPKELTAHGQTRIDNYYWLRERENPEVIRYLEEENKYTAAKMRHLEPLQEEIFNEIVARLPESDESIPVRKSGWFWRERFTPGREYPIHVRSRTADGAEEVVLAINELAAGHSYLSVSSVDPNDDGSVVAYGIDTVGRRKFDIHFKDLRTGATLPDVIPSVTYNHVWAADGRTLFYTRQDPVTLRKYQVWRHTLGTDPSKDVLVFQEDDNEFRVWLYRSRSKKYVMFSSNQTLADEVYFIDANAPASPPRLIQKRTRGHEYSADHIGDSFYIRTNHQARNFRVMRAPESSPAMENWREVVGHREDVLVERVELFDRFVALSERRDGLMRLHVIPHAGGEGHWVSFGEAAYDAWIEDDMEAQADVLRYGYSSLTTPDSIYDYDMGTRTKTLRKREKIGGGFDPANYETIRLHAPTHNACHPDAATAVEGSRGRVARITVLVTPPAPCEPRRIPISLVYRKGIKPNGTSPLLLHGYGAYGSSLDPEFIRSPISLLDRGFVYAIAHVRGGQELGRSWYDEGRLLNKKNTFTDFIDAAEFLIKERYADPNRLFAMGTSAGGLLMAAVVNMRPELWRGVVARVPWVDVVTTQFDPSIPLASVEFDEWGNPEDRAAYDYMLSYSPYDQAKRGPYPNLLVTTGLHDSQVQYWEPAKWVAKLRTLNTADSTILLRTDMESGHSGTTGRFKRHRETAMIYAWLVELAR
jgi:oligopeptidase B